jgi:hypothetical protein
VGFSASRAATLSTGRSRERVWTPN